MMFWQIRNLLEPCKESANHWWAQHMELQPSIFFHPHVFSACRLCESETSSEMSAFALPQCRFTLRDLQVAEASLFLDELCSLPTVVGLLKFEHFPQPFPWLKSAFSKQTPRSKPTVIFERPSTVVLLLKFLCGLEPQIEK